MELGPVPSRFNLMRIWRVDRPSTVKGNRTCKSTMLGFENSPESFDTFRVVSVGTVPEPGTLALLAAGGGAALLLVRRRRRV